MILITANDLMSIEQNKLSERAGLLRPEDLEPLVECLSLKDDDIRYRAFLLLQAKSRLDSGVYSFWEQLRAKLGSENSYQRSLGVMLIAENVQWDTEHKMRDVLPEYLEILQDEKPVTVRQCIQALGTIVQKAPEYSKDIADALLAYDVLANRETMRKLVLLDILHTLLEIRKSLDREEINAYIVTALSGEILDAKSKKAIEKLL